MGIMKLFGSSGIRAVFDKNLEETAVRVADAVGKLHCRVIVGKDTRNSGDAMKQAVISGLMSSNALIFDAGMVSTPTLAYATREFDAGIMITASHNPPEYNGLKLLNPDGSSFGTLQQKVLESMLTSAPSAASPSASAGQVSAYGGAVEKHIAAIIADFPEKLNIKVVVDAGGGAASEITPLLLSRMGCEVVKLNCTPTGDFPRVSEPGEENLKELCARVKETNARLGIAHDGDADRMMAVDEQGRFVSGDKLLAIFIKALGVKDAVTTLDASMVLDELGVKLRRTKIGDTWVSEELRNGGDFGGETAGAWIFPRKSLCPDGIYAAASIASIAAKNRLSSLADAIAVYPLKRASVDAQNVSLERLQKILESLKPREFSNRDGFRLQFREGWLLVRPSGTEPKIRITAEAKTEKTAALLYNWGTEAVKKAAGGK